MTRFLLAIFLLHAAFQISTPVVGVPRRAVALAQAPATTPPPAQPGNATSADPSANQTPGNATPGNATPPGPDPAAATFTSPAGMILVTVKPDKTADYEAVIVALQEALSQAADEETRTLANGWRVFRATDLDAKANAIYIHLLDPAVAETDYRPSLWLDKLLAGAPLELLSKYRDAFATPPTKLPLIEVAKMSVAPVKPSNTTSGTPTSPDKPGNGTPAEPAQNASPPAPKNGTPPALSVPSPPSLSVGAFGELLQNARFAPA